MKQYITIACILSSNAIIWLELNSFYVYFTYQYNVDSFLNVWCGIPLTRSITNSKSEEISLGIMPSRPDFFSYSNYFEFELALNKRYLKVSLSTTCTLRNLKVNIKKFYSYIFYQSYGQLKLVWDKNQRKYQHSKSFGTHKKKESTDTIPIRWLLS